MGHSLFVGVDIGGTKIATVVARPSGQVLGHLAIPTAAGPSSDAAVIESIIRAIQMGMDKAQVSPQDIASIGIGAPGGVDVASGSWFGSTNVRLASPPVPLAALVKERFGRPTFVDNDVKAGALGEYRYGAGRGKRYLVYLSVGTGIAAGVVVDGKLYRGMGNAGEIGHVPVERGGPLCACGTRGCLEMMASGAAVARRGRVALQAGRETLLTHLSEGDPARVTGKLVFEAAAKGDPVAMEIVEETATYLAMGVLMAFRAYDPELLVIAGGLSLAGDTLLVPLRDALRRQAGASAESYLKRLLPTPLGEKAGVLGAVALALQMLGD